jgi:hypothetical protein
MGKRQVRISHELLVDVLSTGWNADGRIHRCVEGLPEGVVLVEARAQMALYVGARPDLLLIFEHPMWTEAADGAELPYITPTYQTEYPEEAR